MNKEEVLYQLKQETIEMLASADETRVHEATGGNPTEKSDGTPHPKKKRKGLSAILHHCLSNDTEDELSYEEKADREVKRYEEYPSVDMDTEPLVWWKDE